MCCAVVYASPLTYKYNRALVGSPFKDCGSQESQVSNVDIQNCPDGSQICDLKKGTNASIGITFTTNSDISAINVLIHGIIAGVPVPFPAPQPDACKDSGLTCPLSAKGTYSYMVQLPILTSYPAVKLTVKWELVDGNTKNDIVCVIIPAEIVN
jgi:Niemann-Pick C2 protein